MGPSSIQRLRETDLIFFASKALVHVMSRPWLLAASPAAYIHAHAGPVPCPALPCIMRHASPGGRVEALESGVFRADLPMRFKCKPATYQGLIDNIDRDLQYMLLHDAKWKDVEEVANYQEVRSCACVWGGVVVSGGGGM